MRSHSKVNGWRHDRLRRRRRSLRVLERYWSAPRVSGPRARPGATPQVCRRAYDLPAERISELGRPALVGLAYSILSASGKG